MVRHTVSVVGSAPKYFRAPAGLRNPFLDPILAHHDLKLASWTRRSFDTVNGDPGSVHRRLTAELAGREQVTQMALEPYVGREQAVRAARR